MYNSFPAGEAVDAYAADLVRFDTDYFKRYCKAQHGTFAWYRKRVQGKVLFVNYLQVADGSAYPRCTVILGVAPLDPPPPGRRRLNDGDILDRFHPDDHKAIMDCLTDSGRRRWRFEK
ncbi:hypothetical protein [Acuticoccus sediminis]|uniref:hypothetical protein n=1 Tax=Acuticoccus sediminis TaxID=2184697 RepID=UPI001CFEAF1D|nr:hypothetical protein [Acuticoccus sediminis]